MTSDLGDHPLEICLSQSCVDDENYKNEDHSFHGVASRPVAGEKVDEPTDHAGHENNVFDEEQFSSCRPRGLDARHPQNPIPLGLYPTLLTAGIARFPASDRHPQPQSGSTGSFAAKLLPVYSQLIGGAVAAHDLRR
jgi:hypothetical protein